MPFWIKSRFRLGGSAAPEKNSLRWNMPKRHSKTGDENLSLFASDEASANEPSRNQESASPRIESGATGGPPTVHGVDYQLKVALYEAYRMIAEVLAAPFRDLTITLEARNIQEHGVTRWDVGLGLPTRLLEVKLNASRAEIAEWLDRIGQTHDAAAEFRLVYGGTSGTLAASLSRLMRLAHEASGDQACFLKLCQKEQIRDTEFVLQRLGASAFSALQRMSLRHFPEHLVSDQVTWMARMLCPTDSDSLTRYLREEFFRGIQVRKTFLIRELVDRCQTKGFDLLAPQAIVLDELARPLRAAVALLRYCSAGVPTSVLAHSVGCTEEELPNALRPLIDGRSLALDGERWRLLIRPPAIPPAEEREVLERGLRALLRYIDDHDGSGVGRSLLLDAVSLTRACAGANPAAVVRTFRHVEKILKRHGNKHLVLELADLTIVAAQGPFRGEEEVRAEAQALICGRSWALQRLGDLDGAKKAAKESLELGVAIGWVRNTAFCKKCTGRLARMYAEAATNSRDRSKYLKESVTLLTEAIETFSTMKDIGPNHPEVGDCYSLIARTYLVAKHYSEARGAIGGAYRLIPPDGSKDHLDLLILMGDIDAATGHPEAAEQWYSEALALPQAADVQLSEIFARGYLQRGKNRSTLGRPEGAQQDFENAMTIWRQLEEYEMAARARWEAIQLATNVDHSVLEIFGESSSHLVRVTAFESYMQNYIAPGGQTIAQRAAPSVAQLRQLLAETQRQVKIKYPRP
jgi:tetratricopeptide (TPR) repeat protein